MKRRGNWKIQEEEFMKYLVQEKKLKKWNIIAKLINKRYNSSNKTGKQCREKWFNNLDPALKNNQWTKQEQDNLFRLQSEKGCRWIQIAKKFQGRSQNNVKNHYYNTFRKIIRKINNYRKIFKIKSDKISNNQLNTILSISQDRNSIFASQLIQKCKEIKSAIIEFNNYQIENNQLNGIQKCTHIIHQIHQSYKMSKPILKDQDELTKSSPKIKKLTQINQINILEEHQTVQIQKTTRQLLPNETPQQELFFQELALSPLRQMSELFEHSCSYQSEVNYLINFY